MGDLRGSPNTNAPVRWKKSEDISRISRGTVSILVQLQCVEKNELSELQIWKLNIMLFFLLT